MNHLSWNCRGLGNARAVRVLRDLVKSRKPDFLFLSETLVCSNKINELCSSLGFAHSFSVDRIGRGGGLAVLWKNTVSCYIGSSSTNHIDVIMLKGQTPHWRLTCFYGYPERERRRESWGLIRNLASTSSLPWCIMGDFNDLLFQTDKEGRNNHPQSLLDGFRETVEDCGLMELDLNGGKYTWEKGKGTSHWVRERLDRAFATGAWWQIFPLCSLTVHHTVYSDHDPINLELYSVTFSKKQFRFKFENTWLREPGFHSEVKNHWDNLPRTHLLPKLISISSFMAKWGRNFFHKFRDKLSKQKMTVNNLADKIDEESIKKYFVEKDKLHELLLHEECYWKQRAKTFWLAEGDTNSKVFHAYASARKKANFISSLKTEEGVVVTEKEEMNRMVVEYFQKVFSDQTHGRMGDGESAESVVTNEQNAKLIAEISFAEFTAAVKQMHPDKASGPDGLNPAFFQQFWTSVGRDVFDSCKDWLNRCAFPTELNDTNVVLIPKKEKADRMTDLRPIALCNVLYKILAKVLANRLKVILPGLISEHQSAFVPGRNISDNVLVAFELIHHMKQKRTGNIGEVALKLDISKAYDRVDWGFLRARMQQLGFCMKWISWIMLCVTTVQYSFCFNGSLLGPVVPSRGLRQGDPLSPYLFLLCVEGLSQAIRRAEANNKINGCKVSRSAPSVTHLLFADDSFLFFRADQEEAREVRNILSTYELFSGQAVNYQKSGIFFSSNVRTDKQQEVKNILNVHNDLTTSSYLGLPSLVGRSKKSVFKFLKDRIWKRIQGWNAKLLSRAGKAVLIKNVASAIPSYCMSCFLIPKTLCQEIERMLNGFWWSSNSTSTRGIRWLAWDRMSMSKSKGGLGFRNLYGFNLAMLGKHVWNFVYRPHTLAARVFKARYYPQTHVLSAKRSGGSSFIWSGIYAAKEELKKGFKWVLGDGNDICVGTDPWVRGKPNFKLDNNYDVANDMKVAQLFCHNSRAWDERKIRSLFSEEDARAILSISIPQRVIRDKVAWVNSKDGHYTVKSGYQTWQESSNSNENIEQSNGWKRLWKLQVPSKVKFFIWRFCRNNVPVRAVLIHRSNAIPLVCPMCNTDVEHLLHVFFDCGFASQCWQAAGLSFNMWEVEDAPKWLLDKLNSENYDQLARIAMILWGIWFFRNKRVWENRVVSPSFAAEWSLKQLQEWKNATMKLVSSSQVSAEAAQVGNSKWVKPEYGTWKVNVDAAMVQGSSNFAIGMVLRDHTGVFIAGRTKKFSKGMQVMEAEAIGIEEALSWVMEKGARDVCVESDSLLAVQAINGSVDYQLEVGHTIEACRSILASRSDIYVRHVRRLANRVAHSMARIPCELNCLVDFSIPPRSVLDSVMYDASS